MVPSQLLGTQNISYSRKKFGDSLEKSILSLPAVHRDRALLTKLLLGLVDLANEVNESLSRLGHPLLRPVRELELSDGPALAVPGVRHLELPQDVLRHVVLGQRVHHEVLIARAALTGPVLRALVAPHLSQLGQHDHDGAVVLPQHPPEVLHSLVERSLCGNVSVPVSVAVKEAGIDVVTALDAPQRLQTHST